MKRVAILLDDKLGRGEVGNISAILMGQAALLMPDLFGSEPVCDSGGNKHAAIRFSTILLKASSTQMVNLLPIVKEQAPDVICIFFTRVGQSLHNEFDQYRSLIESSKLPDLEPIGTILAGDDRRIRDLTKKFSLLRS